jgi:hypothetical protein
MILQKRQLVRKPGAVSRPGSTNKPVQSIVLHIEQSTGKVSIYDTTWLIMGLPGIGKSTLASGFDGALVLCTSRKEIGSLVVPFLLIDSWEKMLEVTDELLNNRQKYAQYRFIVIDFVDAVFTMCESAMCEKLGVQHQSDAQYGKGTDLIDGIFKRWVTELVASDYGIVFVSHVVQKDVIVPGGMITKTVCSMKARGRNILFPLVNVIGCMEYKTVKVPNTTTGKIELQRKRIINFSGSEYVEAKDRDGILPDEVVLTKDAKRNFQVFKDYYEGKRVK